MFFRSSVWLGLLVVLLILLGASLPSESQTLLKNKTKTSLSTCFNFMMTYIFKHVWLFEPNEIIHLFQVVFQLLEKVFYF